MNITKIKNHMIRRLLVIIVSPIEITYTLGIYIGKGFIHAKENIQYGWKGEEE